MKTIKELTVKAQSGDKVAFGKLYEDLYDKIFGYTYKKTFDHAAAGDITANTFIKLIENLHRFEWQNESAFYGWVFKICSGEISNYFKKQNKYNLNTNYFDEDTCDLFEDIMQSRLTEDLDKKLDKDRLQTALKKLKKKEQHIVELHYFADMSHKQIAEMKNMNEGNVRVIAHRAVKKLKDLLSHQEYKLITEGAGK